MKEVQGRHSDESLASIIEGVLDDFSTKIGTGTTNNTEVHESDDSIQRSEKSYDAEQRRMH